MGEKNEMNDPDLEEILVENYYKYNNKREMKILSFLDGYKTFIIGFCGLVWGMYTNNTEVVITCLGMIGLRQAISKMEIQ